MLTQPSRDRSSMSKRGRLLLKLIALMLILSHEVAAQPTAKGEEMNEAFLVPVSDLQRHGLSAMRRSFLNVALRQDSLTYMDSGELSSPTFFGLGGPLVPYKRLHWRSFTLWVNPEIGYQLESALSAVVYQHGPDKEWYLPSEYLIGFHGGLQELQSYNSDYSTGVYSYAQGDRWAYRSPEPLFYGLQLAIHFQSWWIEFTWDYSELYSEEDTYTGVYSYKTSSDISVTRVGLIVGLGLL